MGVYMGVGYAQDQPIQCKWAYKWPKKDPRMGVTAAWGDRLCDSEIYSKIYQLISVASASNPCTLSDKDRYFLDSAVMQLPWHV